MTALFEPEGPLVLGVDPSLTGTGLAWPDGTLIKHGRSGLTVADKTSLGQRGAAMKTLILELGNYALSKGIPTLVIIEQIPKIHLDSYRAYVWWSVVNLLTAQGATCVEVEPSEIKKYATGRGGAAKEAVVEATVRRLPHFQTGGSTDLCDATWACAMGRAVLGHPIADVPQTHRDALKTLRKRMLLVPHVPTTEEK